MLKSLFRSNIKNIDGRTLDQLLLEKNSTRQFIDVRGPGEFRANHIKGFTNIPLNEITNRLTELDTEKEIVVICAAGVRSLKAARTLSKSGFELVTNVKGGFRAY